MYMLIRAFFSGLRTLLTWTSALLAVIWAWSAGEGLLQAAWCRAFRARRLRPDEIAASLEVHPPGLIDYECVRVTDDSPICRVNGGRAFTSFNVVHYPSNGVDLGTAVHELSHIAQYQHIGSRMMVEALYAQLLGSGYSYGDLRQARRQGKLFRHFNREQQAQLCDDYYRASHGEKAWFGGTAEDLQPFIDDMRDGGF
jgi:hypothetical protein